jgi:hypothetical protein
MTQRIHQSGPEGSRSGAPAREATASRIRTRLATAVLAAGLSTLAAGPAARAHFGFFIGAGPPVDYAPPPPPPVYYYYYAPPPPRWYYPPPAYYAPAPPLPRPYFAPPPAYRYWPY